VDRLTKQKAHRWKHRVLGRNARVVRQEYRSSNSVPYEEEKTWVQGEQIGQLEYDALREIGV
jgi:hypothetical protein